ncbi:MAG: hypothetical protein NWS40_01715 [Crocinitomicaceae bacterium]|jgi:hypothetical protein|nr:hypothetical protein [Crocinitomicaceae bacterium]MDP4867135.1 hypothetical protein [Crocinitomicaceae bacterium]MDP5011212.1 hypothetical protein [Crocinitomicaceae bacterium]
MKILLFSLFFHLSALLFSQGNLQFNQVKLIGDAPLTVPTEKVWKIESATLSIKDGIRVPPRFIIGNDTIQLGYDSYSTSILENVVSVKLEWKGNNNGVSGTCGCCCTSNNPSNGSNNVFLVVGGNSNGSNILSENLAFSNIPATNITSYSSLGNTNLVNGGDNIVTSWTLYFNPISTQPCLPTYTTSVWGVNYSFRVTFLLANGNAVSYEVTKSQFNCGGAPQLNVTNPTIATETRSRPQVTTQFPIWVPSGTVIKTLTNIAKLSVLEFNIIP